ncbi:hypothetical protein, partial [Acinetobacter baumannii]|uniref:hypothetical protein n=1 Tax=Acinetobacter baumannii TaxID=470 RepID=UPI001BC898FD
GLCCVVCVGGFWVCLLGCWFVVVLVGVGVFGLWVVCWVLCVVLVFFGFWVGVGVWGWGLGWCVGGGFLVGVVGLVFGGWGFCGVLWFVWCGLGVLFGGGLLCLVVVGLCDG